MAKWKDNLNKISGKSEQEREAAFEAAMLAELGRKTSSPNPPAPRSQPTAGPARPAISITVTENGQTTTYPDLASVPVALRQQIVSAWLGNSSGTAA